MTSSAKRQALRWGPSLALAVACLVTLVGGSQWAVRSTKQPALVLSGTASPSATPQVTPVSTPVPTYIAYATVVRATAIAIAPTLPTVLPEPGLAPARQAQRQQDARFDAALATAVALNPLPPGYDPRSELTPAPTVQPFPTEPPPPHHATGNGDIYDAGGAENPTANMISTVNFWAGSLAGQKVLLYAGNVKELPTQGAIVLAIWPPSGANSEISTEAYVSPTQAGPLHVIDVTGTRVTLLSDQGARFVFDLPTRQWVAP